MKMATTLPLFLLLVLIAYTAAQVEIRSLSIITDIRFRFAKTRIISRVANSNTTGSEVTFAVTIPNDAFISAFEFKIGELVYTGRINERVTAEGRYQVSKESGQAAGYVGTTSFHESNRFKMVVFVPAETKVTFNLTYEEVLQRREGVYRHNIYLDPGHVIPDLTVECAIQDSRDITTLKVPPIQTNAESLTNTLEDSSLALIDRPTSTSAVIKYRPSLEDQKARQEEQVTGIFSVLYDVDRASSAGDLLVSNGFFVHFFAPPIAKSYPKDILFILDKSTSMLREKMRHVKEAMKIILKDLNPEDRYNILMFGSRTKLWRTNMTNVSDPRSYRAAMALIDNIKPLGWTNIGKSTKTGMKYLTSQSRHPEGSMIILLTDGRPTAGEVSQKVILKNIQQFNTKKIPVYTLAFGWDADWELMKQISLQNYGIGRRIYADGNPAHQIAGFYNEVSSVLMHGVSLKYSDGTTKEPINFNVMSYNEGSEVVFAAPIRDNSVTSLTVDITGDASTGEMALQRRSSELDLSQFQRLTDLYEGEGALEKMIARMWANIHVKELLKQRATEVNKHKREKKKQRALKISLKYGLVTPFTSMLAVVQSGGLRLTDIARDNDIYTFKEKVLPTPPPYTPRRRYYGGGGGGGGGYSRGGGGGDPHFMVYMDGLNYPVCFDVPGEDNQMYQLIRDPQTGLTVNIRMGRGKKQRHSGGFREYMVEVAILTKDLTILINRKNVSLPGQTFDWKTGSNTSIPGAEVFLKTLNEHTDKLTVVLDNQVVVDITNHVHRDNDPLGGDFLNVELGHQHLLSPETDGVLGQFIHKKIRLSSVTYRNEHLIGHLRSRSGLVKTHGRARIRERRDPVWGDRTSCWMLHAKAEKLFDAPPEFYIIQDILQKTL